MATPLGASIRIAKIECDKYSTNLTAPDHGLPTGTRVKVRGRKKHEDDHGMGLGQN